MKSFESFIEKTVNQYFSLDPESKSQLQKINGKVIAFTITRPPLTFFLKFDQDKVILLDACEKPDASIKGDLFSFLQLKFQSSDLTTLSKTSIELSGDAELAETFNAILNSMEIDWEEHLSHFTGDIVAHSLLSVAGAVKSWGVRAMDTLERNLSEYIQEEACLTPSKRALEDFYEDLKKLQHDVERLDARFKKGKFLCEE